MDRITAVVLGKKLKLTSEIMNNKTFIKVFVLTPDMNSVAVGIRDNGIKQKIESVKDMDDIKIKAEISTYKDRLYCHAIDLA